VNSSSCHNNNNASSKVTFSIVIVGFIVVGWLLSGPAITYVSIQKANAVEATTAAKNIFFKF
jgi:uncharacterized protein (DUF983 family)